MTNGSNEAAAFEAHKRILRALLKHSPTIGLVISAVIYATGFLIVFIFHDSYRLRAVDTDLFKVRFFHVGIMFAALLGNIAFPIVAFATYIRYRDGPPKWVLGPLGIIAFTIMIFNFLFVLFFLPPGTFRNWNVQSGLIATVVIPVGLGFLLMFIKRLQRPVVRTIVRVVVLIALPTCTALIAKDSLADIAEMFWPAACWFVFLAGVMAALIVVLAKLGDEVRETHEQRLRMGFCIAIFALLYFLAINSFALGLYNFIPSAKGGGDFRKGRVILRLSDESASIFPFDLLDHSPNRCETTKELVFIEGTSNAIYLADPDENGGPAKWRSGVAQRPSVIEFKRDKITIEYRAE